MAHHPSPLTPGSGFRRRFPLELSPDEYARLEEAGRAAGSKRAALLAGLAALEETSALRTAAARAEKTRSDARAQIADLTAKVAALERALADAKAKATAGAARERDATE